MELGHLVSDHKGNKPVKICKDLTRNVSYSLLSTARYSIVAPPPPSGVSLRFSFANTPTFPFFTNDRPWAYTSDQTATISSWMYGFDSNLSPYVARRMSDLPTMFSNWAAQDVRTITGDLDTFSR